MRRRLTDQADDVHREAFSLRPCLTCHRSNWFLSRRVSCHSLPVECMLFRCPPYAQWRGVDVYVTSRRCLQPNPVVDGRNDMPGLFLHPEKSSAVYRYAASSKTPAQMRNRCLPNDNGRRCGGRRPRDVNRCPRWRCHGNTLSYAELTSEFYLKVNTCIEPA